MDILVYLGLMLASYFIASALAPKPADAKPAALADFDFPQSTEGTAQAVVFGDVWIEGWMVLGVGNYRTTPIRK